MTKKYDGWDFLDDFGDVSRLKLHGEITIVKESNTVLIIRVRGDNYYIKKKAKVSFNKMNNTKDVSVRENYVTINKGREFYIYYGAEGRHFEGVMLGMAKKIPSSVNKKEMLDYVQNEIVKEDL